MTKEVLIKVSGRQYDIGDEPVELTLPGTYYLKNGKHYVLYEEPSDDGREPIRNRVKFHDGNFEMVKRGAVSSALSFIQNERTGSVYRTGAGDVMMEVETHDIIINEMEHRIHTKVAYALYINGQFISECEVDFRVMAQEDS